MGPKSWKLDDRELARYQTNARAPPTITCPHCSESLSIEEYLKEEEWEDLDKTVPREYSPIETGPKDSRDEEVQLSVTHRSRRQQYGYYDPIQDIYITPSKPVIIKKDGVSMAVFGPGNPQRWKAVKDSIRRIRESERYQICLRKAREAFKHAQKKRINKSYV